MGAKAGMVNEAKGRRQGHHKDTKKYVKQRERTAYNKIRNQLLNAAGNNKTLLATFAASNGGWKKILLMAQNALNMEGYLDAIKSKAGQAPKGTATPLQNVR